MYAHTMATARPNHVGKWLRCRSAAGPRNAVIIAAASGMMGINHKTKCWTESGIVPFVLFVDGPDQIFRARRFGRRIGGLAGRTLDARVVFVQVFRHDTSRRQPRV